jgi:hypothetical protein
VNPHFLAVCLAVFAACAVLGILPAAVLAARARQPVMVAVAVVLGLGAAAVLANAGADLW